LPAYFEPFDAGRCHGFRPKGQACEGFQACQRRTTGIKVQDGPLGIVDIRGDICRQRHLDIGKEVGGVGFVPAGKPLGTRHAEAGRALPDGRFGARQP